MTKQVYLTIEILEGHAENCPGSLPDRCKRNSVTGRVELNDALLSAAYPEMAQQMVRDWVAELVDGAWERFTELRDARQ